MSWKMLLKSIASERKINSMCKYRKKPIVIEAHQWTGNGTHPKDHPRRPFEDTGLNPVEDREGALVRYFRRPDMPGNKVCEHCGCTMHIHGWIDTLEDGHRVCPKDFIIKGIQGEFYPCKPDIFEATYEKVED